MIDNIYIWLILLTLSVLELVIRIVVYMMSCVFQVNYDSRYPYLQGYNSTKIVYKTNFTFHCWGYDGDIYIDHSVSFWHCSCSLVRLMID